MFKKSTLLENGCPAVLGAGNVETYRIRQKNNVEMQTFASNSSLNTINTIKRLPRFLKESCQSFNPKNPSSDKNNQSNQFNQRFRQLKKVAIITVMWMAANTSGYATLLTLSNGQTYSSAVSPLAKNDILTIDVPSGTATFTGNKQQAERKN